jgi:hypothetical protein
VAARPPQLFCRRLLPSASVGAVRMARGEVPRNPCDSMPAIVNNNKKTMLSFKKCPENADSPKKITMREQWHEQYITT